MAYIWLDLEFVNISQQKIIEGLEKNTSPSHSDFAGNLGEMFVFFFVLKYKEENQLVRAL